MRTLAEKVGAHLEELIISKDDLDGLELIQTHEGAGMHLGKLIGTYAVQFPWRFRNVCQIQAVQATQGLLVIVKDSNGSTVLEAVMAKEGGITSEFRTAFKQCIDTLALQSLAM